MYQEQKEFTKKTLGMPYLGQGILCLHSWAKREPDKEIRQMVAGKRTVWLNN